MRLGPGDIEIDEIGLDEALERAVPGPEVTTEPFNPPSVEDTQPTIIDDPLDW